eukprot:gene739-742_t
MEMFETDCQTVLNEYLEGFIKEKNLITDARTWPNYKDYRPMIEFAKTNHSPVIAANAPSRYTSMTNRFGLSSLQQLSTTGKSFLPPLPIDTATGPYYDKFKEIMGGHGSMPGMQLYQAQNLWDATMGWSITRFYRAHKGFKVLQLNGGFHSEEKLGAAAQLKKYAPDVRMINIAVFADESFAKTDWSKFSKNGDYIIITDPNLPRSFFRQQIAYFSKQYLFFSWSRIGEINAACYQPDRRHNDICNQRGNYFTECRADNHANRKVPTVSLDTRIKEELEENPALEDLSLTNLNEPEEQYPDRDPEEDSYNGDEEKGEADEFNIEDYLQEDNVNEYGSRYDQNGDDDDERKEIPIAVQSSFFESLQQQLDLLPLSDKDFRIGKQIIGSLDDDGYLRRPIMSLTDDLAFSQNVMATDEEVEDMLKVIQSFDPAGVGARSLQECLLIQLRKKDPSDPIIKKAMNVVEHYLDEFTRKHYDKLEKSLNMSSIELRGVVNEILKLNPKPGDSNEINTKQLQVIPDFHITNNDGFLILTLNSKNAPELRVSRSYQEMFEHYDKASQKDKKLKEAVQFVKQKLDSAKWFIDAIKQRQQTLLKTMNAIMQYQYEFFLTGDDKNLKPMILKDIADRINMDISTVSRVANSKYVQTEFGTFLLKSFFSEAIQTESGEEVSNKEVKKILEEHIGAEDKKHPLADEKLTEILKDAGYNIARRTVAKYREQMNIPVARLRKEL